jgi:hypothetical protein
MGELVTSDRSGPARIKSTLGGGFGRFGRDVPAVWRFAAEPSNRHESDGAAECRLA